MRTLSFVAAVAVLLASGHPSRTAFAQGAAGPKASPAKGASVSAPPPDLDTARRAVFVEAVQAMEAKDWATCQVKALGVWGQKQHPQTAALLGICEAELGKYADAAEHLDYHRKRDDGKSPDRTQDVEAAWQKVRSKVGIATIECSVPDVDVKINGKPKGQAPLTIYLTESVTLEAKKQGYKAKLQGISVNAGETQTVTIALDIDKENPPPSGKPAWPAIVLGGVAAAGLGVGVGLVVVGAGKNSEADDLAATCAPPTAGCVETGAAALDDADTMIGIGIGGFALAGAALVGMTVYLVLPDPAEPTTALSLSPSISPSFTGLTLRGGF